MSSEMFALADKLKKLKEVKSDLAEQTKENNSEIEKTEIELAKIMTDTETQSFNRAGTIFFLNTKLYASAIADKKIELYETLKQEGFGSMITEIINANSFAAFVREQMEQNEDALPTWLEGKVNVFDKVSVGLRKSK